MSDTFDPKNPKPLTRRDVVENKECERGFFGGPELRVSAGEPLPDIEETGYREVLAREVPSNGLEIRHRGFFIAAATMTFVGLITFYMPFFNGLLAGALGGFFARRWGRAFGAAALASVAVPAIIAFIYSFKAVNLYYFMSGLGFWGWTALHVLGTFIGAASGVYSRPLEDRRGFRRDVTAG